MAPRNEENSSQTPHPEQQQMFSQLSAQQYIKMDSVKQAQANEVRHIAVSRNEENQANLDQIYLQQFIKMETASKQEHHEQQRQLSASTLPTTIYGNTISSQQLIRYENACPGGPSVERYAGTPENGKEVVMIFNPDQQISEGDNKKTFANLGSVTTLSTDFMSPSYPGYLPSQVYLTNTNQQFILKNDPSLSSARPPHYSQHMSYESSGPEGTYWSPAQSTVEFPMVGFCLLNLTLSNVRDFMEIFVVYVIYKGNLYVTNVRN